MDNLIIRSPISGKWIAPDATRMQGAFVQSGTMLGTVADLSQLRIRAVAGQDISALLEDAQQNVEFRIKGMPPQQSNEYTGTIEKTLPAGSHKLPSAALGYAVGGGVQTDPQKSDKSIEKMFTMVIAPDSNTRDRVELMSGQRVVVRVFLKPKPLASQWYRKIRQLFQNQFR